MRPFLTGIPSVRRPERARTARRKSGWLAQVFFLLLMLLGGTWSHEALAARAICVLNATAPTSQTGATNASLSYAFTVDNGFVCGSASGTIAIASDTTGGAVITSGGTFTDTGAAPFTNNFSIALGPNPGSVSVTVTCTSAACTGATLNYTATALTPNWTVVASSPSFDDNDGSGSVTPGDQVHYNVVVTNTSGNGLTLNNVFVQDTIGASTTCATLADGSSCTLPDAYVVKAADANTTLTYQGRGRSTELGGRTGTLSNIVSTAVVAAAPGMTVVKSQPSFVDADSSGNVSLGDTLTYKVVATNTGNVKLSSVVITDPIIPSLSQNCSDLARSGQPGDTCTVTGTYVVTSTDVTNGSITNTAQGNTSSGVGPIPSNTVVTPVAGGPGLTLVKSQTGFTDNDHTGNVTVGDVINYQVVATNTGGGNLTHLVINDGNATPASLVCTTPLPKGSTCTLTASHTVTGADFSAGQVSNSATATVDQITAGATSNTVTTSVSVGASMSLLKSFVSNTDNDHSGNVTVGDLITYRIRVSNNGGSNLTNIAVSDPNATISGGCTGLAPTSFCDYTATHTVSSADLGAGQATNTASATSDQFATPVTSNTVNTAVAASPSMTVVKSFVSSADNDRSGNVTVGDVLTYSIVVTNNGGGTLTNVALADPNATLGATTCSSLTSGSTCTWSATHTVTAADLRAGQAANTASATSDQITTPVVSNTITTAVSASPSVTVVKSFVSSADNDRSGNVTVGDVLTYSIVVTNNGGGTLTNVVLSDPNATLGATTCSSLAVGSTCTWSATHTVNAADLRAGQATNRASATSDQITTAIASNTVTTAVAAGPSVTVVKSFTGNTDNDRSGNVTVGDVLTYSIAVTNNGGGTLTNVALSDPNATLGSTSCSSLAVGSTCTWSATHTVNAADLRAAQATNAASATSDQITTPVVSNTVTTAVAASPSMTVVKSFVSSADNDRSGNVTVGDVITYKVVVTNNGGGTLTNVLLADPNATLGSTSCTSLAAGSTCTWSATHTVNAADLRAGQATNTASATSDQIATAVPSNTVNTAIAAGPSVTVVKSFVSSADNDRSGNVTVGDVLTYSIAVTNNGGGTLTNVVLADPNATLGATTCSSLAVGSTCTWSATHTVNAADRKNGQATNTASATSDQITAAVNSNTVNTAIAASPSMTVVKSFVSSADNDKSGNVTIGDVITYQIVVTNNGGGTLTNVLLADPNATLGATTCSSLAVGSTCTWSATHTVTAADQRNGQATNTASATSDQVTTAIKSNTVTVGVSARPSMSLVKSQTTYADNDRSGNVTVGDVISYQVVATNTGGGALTNLAINDGNALPASTSCANVPIGGNCTLAATHTVTAGDLKAGSVSNVGTATSDQITTAVTSNTINTPVFASPAMTVGKVLSSNSDPDRSGTVTEGDVLTYVVTMTNTGGGIETGVTVKDPLTSPATQSCASVAVGATCVLSGTYTVTRADVNAGNIRNTGTATSTQLPTGLSSTLNTRVFTSPNATVTKVLAHNQDGDHSGTVTVGDVLTFTVTGTNTGNVVLASMTVSDPLTTPNAITCSNVAIGGTCVLSGIYTVTATDLRNGSISNTGSVTSPQLRAAVTTTLVTPVLSTPAMTITKVLTSNADGDHSGTVSVGDVLTYTVTATNSGNVALTGVNVGDPLTTPSTFGCANVAIGGTCVLVGTYTVTAADASKGSISNTGSATARQLTKAVQASLTTPVSKTAPGMSVTKVLTKNADGDGSGTVSQGDVLTYAVTVTNTGTEILGNVVVNDPLTKPGTTTCATLAIGATCTLTGNYTVTAADVARGTISNTGTATSNQTTAGAVSNTVTTPVTTTTSMSVSKVLASNADGDASGNVTAGDVLTFKVTATNTGNVVLNSVTVNDPLTTPNTATCANVAAGGTCVLTGTYTATAADASKGSISNTGSATAAGQITTPVTQTLKTPVTVLSRTIAIASGDGQSGPQNSNLGNPLVVSVLNNANPANGVTVNWAVTSGTATLLGGATSIVSGGQASNTVKLGATAGPVTITATRADDTTQSVIFHETITAPALSIVSGNNQIGVVGSDAVEPLVVHLVDGSGHPFGGQPVTWQVVSGPASLLGTTPVNTDPNGNAQVNFAYGASTGAIVIRASAAGSSIDFTESAQSYRITILGGNNQTANPGQRLPQDFTVQVAYPTGMTTHARTHAAHTLAPPTLAGVSIQWNVVAGGGTLSQGNVTVTDVNGRASNHYTVGTGTGLNKVQVVVPGGDTATFLANSAATSAAIRIVSGNNQDLAPNTSSQALVVELTDNGIPLSNVTVKWSATNATLNSATSVTDNNGQATNTAKVTDIGPATVNASTTAPAAGPVTFGLNGGLSFIGGLTPVEGQITGAIDNACSTLATLSSLTPAQQDLLRQCNALSSSTDPTQTVSAIDQLFSDEAYLETSAAMLISTAQFDNIKARIAALRSGTGGDHFGGLAFSTPSGTMPVGSLGVSALQSASDAKDKQDASSGFDRWGFFLSGTFSHGSSDPRQSLPGYGFNTNGVTGGVDYRFSDKFIAGVSAGYAKYRSDLDAGLGSMNTNGWSLAAYATFFQKDNWYLDGVLTWGSNSYDLTRKINYTLTGPSGTTTVNQVADGNDSGTTLAAAFTFGRDFNKGPWSFGPYFRGTWTRVDFDGYQEKLQPGPGMGLGLAVQTHPLQSTATVLGAKINYASSQSWGVMMPHAEIEWQHEFQDNPDTITAHFLQDPTQTPINVNGFPVDNSFFRAGLGVSFVFPHGRSGFVYYEKTLGRSGITQDSIALGLRIEF